MSNERIEKVRPFGSERSDLKKRSRLLLPVLFLTLVALNVARAMCLRYCLSWSWYQRILYDDIHHYQLGVLLLPIGFLLLKTHPRLKSLLFGVAIAFILDELFFVLEWFEMDPYFHRTFFRWMSFDLIAFLVFATVYQLSISRLKSHP